MDGGLSVVELHVANSGSDGDEAIGMVNGKGGVFRDWELEGERRLYWEEPESRRGKG